MNHVVVPHHWKSKLFVAAIFVAAGPLVRGQSAPADAPKATPTPAPAPVTADRAYLGVYINPENDNGGVKLEKVVDGSPAAKAGLQSGDVIVALGDHTIGNEEELREVISSHQVGEKLKVTFMRDGEKRRTSARLGKAPAEVEGDSGEEHEAPAVAEKPAKRPTPPQAEKSQNKVETGTSIGVGGASGGPGFLGVSPSEQDQEHTTITVLPGTPAEKAGLKNGDVIVAVDGTDVGTFDDLVKLMASHHAGDKVTVVVERGGEKQKIKVKLGTRDAATAGGGGTEVHGLGIGGGTIAVPVPPNPPASAAPPAPAKPIKARGRIAAPATNDGAAATTQGAESHDAMRKEFDDLRAQLEKTRKEMEDLRRKCETQQRTIDAIRRALGGGEPGSTSMAAPGSSPGDDMGAVISFTGAAGSAGSSEISFTAPNAAGGGMAVAAAPAQCTASADGAGSCCAAGGEGDAKAAQFTSEDGEKGEHSIVLQLGGDGQARVKSGGFVVQPQHGGKGVKAHALNGGGQVELKLGDDVAKQVHGQLGGGHAMTLKPTGEAGTFELVLGGGEGDEAGEGSCEAGQCEVESAECCEEEEGENGERTIVVQVADDGHGGGHVAHKVVLGGAAPKHAMKVMKVSPKSGHAFAVASDGGHGGGNGSPQVFVVEGDDAHGAGNGCCGEGCCGECCAKNGAVAAKVPGGMGAMGPMGGMVRKGGPAAGAPGGMAGMGGMGRPVLRRSAGMPGMPGMGAGGPPAGAGPAMRGGVMRFGGGMPGAPQRNAQPRRARNGGPGPQQLFKMLGGGGSFTWKCDGPCEFKFGPGGVQLNCQGSCEITRSGGSNEEAAQSGMPALFQMLGAGASEESGDDDDEDSESADDDDSGSREDGDDDDDDDDASAPQAAVAIRVF